MRRCFLCGRVVLRRWWQLPTDVCRNADLDLCKDLFLDGFDSLYRGGQ
jgi:DNA-directed RNA polymerase subunit N (RpoN/RPB10)